MVLSAVKGPSGLSTSLYCHDKVKHQYSRVMETSVMILGYNAIEVRCLSCLLNVQAIDGDMAYAIKQDQETMATSREGSE